MATKNHVIGGKKLSLALQAIEKKITRGGVLRVGFLENATYADGPSGEVLPVAQVAFWNEYGTTRNGGPRPFFRNTITQKSPEWGDKLGKAVVATNYDGEAALRLLGQNMRDDVENAIAQFAQRGNRPSTIAKKGFDKELIDTGIMQRSVDYEVK